MLAAGTGQALDFDSAVNRSYDHSVHIWSVAGDKSLYTLSDPPYGVYALAWSPNGRYLAAGGGLERDNGLSYPDDIIRIWRIGGSGTNNTGQPALDLTLKGHTSKIIALTWYPDGGRLVSADGQSKIVVWRAP
jgi:WD40 repeat protein